MRLGHIWLSSLAALAAVATMAVAVPASAATPAPTAHGSAATAADDDVIRLPAEWKDPDGRQLDQGGVGSVSTVTFRNDSAQDIPRLDTCVGFSVAGLGREIGVNGLTVEVHNPDGSWKPVDISNWDLDKDDAYTYDQADANLGTFPLPAGGTLAVEFRVAATKEATVGRLYSGVFAASGLPGWCPGNPSAPPTPGSGDPVQSLGQVNTTLNVVSSPGSTLHPVAPVRAMDTRDGTGVAKAKVGAGKTVTLQVAGQNGVPATGVSAVVMNVTATGPSQGGYVSVYPNGTQRTTASNLNFTAGLTIPNLVVVPVVNGKVDFFNALGTVDLIADITGYYTGDTTGSTFVTTAPTRLMDTRDGTGVAKAKVGAGKTVTLTVGGKNGIPATGVTAVVLNITATGPSQGGYVSAYPNGAARPGVSNLNFTTGQTIANLAVVPVVNGKVDFFNAFGTVDLIADVTGYYTGDTTGSVYRTTTPTRLLDTRNGTGTVDWPALQVMGKGGISTNGVTAVVLNVTITNPSVGGFVTVYPDGAPRPGVSSLNYTVGQTIPNLVVVPVLNGKVAFYNSGRTGDLIADVVGYYTTG